LRSTYTARPQGVRPRCRFRDDEVPCFNHHLTHISGRVLNSISELLTTKTTKEKEILPDRSAGSRLMQFVAAYRPSPVGLGVLLLQQCLEHVVVVFFVSEYVFKELFCDIVLLGQRFLNDLPVERDGLFLGLLV